MQEQERVSVFFVGFLSELPEVVKQAFSYAIEEELLPTDEKMVILRDSNPVHFAVRIEVDTQGNSTSTPVSSEFSWFPLDKIEDYATEADKIKIKELLGN